MISYDMNDMTSSSIFFCALARLSCLILRRSIAEFEPDQSFGSVPPASSHAAQQRKVMQSSEQFGDLHV